MAILVAVPSRAELQTREAYETAREHGLEIAQRRSFYNPGALNRAPIEVRLKAAPEFLADSLHFIHNMNRLNPKLVRERAKGRRQRWAIF